MFKKFLILVLFINIIFAFTSFQQFSWEDTVNLTPGILVSNYAYNDCSNWATHTPNNRIYCVWYRTTAGYPIIMRWWRQQGNWSPEETVSTGGGISLSQNWYPSIAGDSNNNLHFVWRGYTTVPGTYYGIYYRAKLSTGIYTNICSLPIKPGNMYTNFPKIAGGKGDTAHIVFYVYWGGYYRIGYAKVVPTYPTPTVVDIDTVSPREWTVNSYRPHIAVDGQNRIHIVWCSNLAIGSSIYNIFYRMRDVNGVWREVETVSVGTYYNVIPRVAVDGNGNIHVVWTGWVSSDSLNARIFHRVKTRSGWSDVYIFRPANHLTEWYGITSAVCPNNNLHIAFHTNAWGFRYNIGRLIRYPDGTWEGPDTISYFTDGGLRFSPEIVATRDGNIHLFRMDSAPYTNNYYWIYYKRYLSSGGIKNEKNDLKRFKIILSSIGDYLKISYSLPVNQKVSLNIYNTLGNLIYTSTSHNNKFLIKKRDFTSGIYIMKFNTQEYEVIKKLIIY